MGFLMGVIAARAARKITKIENKAKVKDVLIFALNLFSFCSWWLIAVLVILARVCFPIKNSWQLSK